MKKYIFLFNVMQLFIAGCKKDDTRCKPTNFNGMLPLHIGNEWIYQTTFYDTTGAISLQKFDTLLITGDTIINCDTKYIIKKTFNVGNFLFPPPAQTMNNTIDGFYDSDWTYPFPVQSGNKIIEVPNNNCTLFNYISWFYLINLFM